MRRQLHAGSEGDARLLDECTHTIIGEVEGLKRLVNEFSAFARMPQSRPLPGDLNALAQETLAQFREAHPEVQFEDEFDADLPSIAIDREALKRAIFNLLDNAVAAAVSVNQNGIAPAVAVRTMIDRDSGVVTLEVADNGPGIEPRYRMRIFEPYFSTKKGGTGLGLAIVSSIITDHHGFIRVRDNRPRGSRFIVEFPVRLSQPISVSA
jgi:two-component system nitrogen regulation sensor histidine kinase NtrY